MNKYNLLHEKWIVATDLQNDVGLFSILDIYKYAHNLRGLAGELPTQDIAILRLLLAILHTVFYRYEPNGREIRLGCQSQAVARWRKIWDKRELPFSLINDYLTTEYEDRFYLFHEKYPFMQIKSGQEYKAADGRRIIPSEKSLSYFVGDIAESENKANLFLGRERLQTLPLDEAARWLIHMNGFDLSPSGKPPKKVKKMNGYKSAWLSNLGLVYLQGKTLFDTLLQNLVLGLSDDDDYLNEKPLWEEPIEVDGRILERIEIPAPRTLQKLYSMQFRFIELLASENKETVKGANVWSGCRFTDMDQFLEPMTVWRETKVGLTPRQHSPEKRVWQDFNAIVVKEQKATKRPGVLDWIKVLCDAGVEDMDVVRIVTVGQETKNNTAIKDVYSDGFSIHAQLIVRVGKDDWLLRIRDEIEIIEKLANVVGSLAQNLAIAKGSDNDSFREERRKAKEQAYSHLDAPFRQWLEQIDPRIDEIEIKCKSWRDEAKKIISILGENLVINAGPAAMVGCKHDKKWVTASKAHLWFLGGIRKI